MTKVYYDIEIANSYLGEYNKIGYIRYYKSSNQIKIVGLYVNAQYQGQGFGTVLIILCLCHIIKEIPGAYFIQKISLEDCSSQSLTRNSIYYKFGFRIKGADESLMEINFLRPEPGPRQQESYYKYNGENEQSFEYYESIIQYYLTSTNKEKIQLIFSQIVEQIKQKQMQVFLSTNFNETTRTFLNKEIFDICDCFDISSVISENTHNTRSRTSREYIP
jgi:GNAT superfamily N-acetyltransferase